MASALYTRDGDRYIPSEHTRGPWVPDAQHGGAPAALLARAMEALPADTPMAIARFTLEILRPVPLTPLTVSAGIERPGRRVQLVSGSLHAGETELCRARAWRIRDADLGDTVPDEWGLPFNGPEMATPHEPENGEPAFHRTGVELRFVRGSFWEIGPWTVWIRLRLPVVEDEEPSPVMRVLAAADFGNGVAAALEWGRFLYINTDLAASLYRQPEGEWICLDATTHASRHGVGIAESALYDSRGPIGRSMQTLFVDELQR